MFGKPKGQPNGTRNPMLRVICCPRVVYVYADISIADPWVASTVRAELRRTIDVNSNCYLVRFADPCLRSVVRAELGRATGVDINCYPFGISIVMLTASARHDLTMFTPLLIRKTNNKYQTCLGSRAGVIII